MEFLAEVLEVFLADLQLQYYERITGEPPPAS
jgi:hypothetical protein